MSRNAELKVIKKQLQSEFGLENEVNKQIIKLSNLKQVTDQVSI